MSRILLVEILSGATSVPRDPKTLAELMRVASTTEFVRLHSCVADDYGTEAADLWEAARVRYTEEVKGQ